MSDETAVEIARSVNARETSAVERAVAMAERIAERDGAVGAYLTQTADLARAYAETIDARIAAGERLPLAGVPLAIKDNMCVTGTRTTCASRILEHWISPYTGTAVQRLLAAGALPLGKTNLDEFAMGSSCENSALGKTANPWVRGLAECAILAGRTHGTSDVCRAEVPAAASPPLRRAKPRSRSAAIRAGPFASPPRSAASWVSSRRTVASRATD
jgi:Asp-tRNA(Asn)/Glu-tRNA(Gln) amidotransferase A subunit family amidase